MTAPPSARRSNWRRALLHAPLLVGGWAVFAWFWVIVLGQVWSTFDLWVLIVASVLLLPALTVGWVLHNVALFRRRGPRQALRQVEAAYASDFYGRRIEADWAALSTEREITIRVDGPVKRYSARG